MYNDLKHVGNLLKTLFEDIFPNRLMPSTAVSLAAGWIFFLNIVAASSQLIACPWTGLLLVESQRAPEFLIDCYSLHNLAQLNVKCGAQVTGVTVAKIYWNQIKHVVCHGRRLVTQVD
jgi:hypothetical protein